MAVIMMVVAGFFTLCAVLSLFLLKQVSGWETRRNLWVRGVRGAPAPLVPLGIRLLWKEESGHCQVESFNKSIFLLVLAALVPSHLNAKGACRGEVAFWEGTGGMDASVRHTMDCEHEGPQTQAPLPPDRLHEGSFLQLTAEV